jgi:tetratricopeptide (TPR) repeat protein
MLWPIILATASIFTTGSSQLKSKQTRRSCVGRYFTNLLIWPILVRLYSARAAFWHEREDYVRADEDFSKAIELTPQDMTLYRKRGETRHARRAYADAIADFNTALEQSPNDLSLIFARGKSHLAAGEPQKAAADMDAIVLRFPLPMYEAVKLRIDARVAAGERDKCLQELDALIARFPKAEVWRTLRAEAVRRFDASNSSSKN